MFMVCCHVVGCGYRLGKLWFEMGDTVVGSNLVGPALCVLVPETVVYVNTDKEFHQRGRCL